MYYKMEVIDLSKIELYFTVTGKNICNNNFVGSTMLKGWECAYTEVIDNDNVKLYFTPTESIVIEKMR